MIKKSIIFSLSILAVLLQSTHLSAQPKAISISTLSLPPIAEENVPDLGFVGELFHAVFEPYGYKVDINIYPWARAFELSKKGESSDGIFPSIYSKKREAWFTYSDPIITSGFVLVTRKETGITTYKSLDEFKNTTIGVLRKAVSGSAIDTSDFKKEEGRNFEINIRKLLGKRFDLIAGEYMAIMNIINNKFADRIDELVVIEPPISKVDLHLMVSKKSPNADEILKDCNRGIAAIKSNGKLEKIKVKYGVSDRK